MTTTDQDPGWRRLPLVTPAGAFSQGHLEAYYRWREAHAMPLAPIGAIATTAEFNQAIEW